MQNNIEFNINDVSDTYIENYVKEFISKNIDTINILSSKVFNRDAKTSLPAFQEIIFIELKKACYSFINNNHNTHYIDSYFFSSINRIIKKLNAEGKSSVYICPACKFLKKFSILEVFKNKLTCSSCKDLSISALAEWEKEFALQFSKHNKKGFKCIDCGNFIPDNGSQVIRCPYPQCIFVGKAEMLSYMQHPTVKANLEIPILDEKRIGTFEQMGSIICLKEDFSEYLKILSTIIESQSNMIQFKSYESTIINKLCMYKAYKNILDKFPNEMISYLIFMNKNVKIQHKIFQEFIKNLENSLPFTFKKNNKLYTVNSITDNNLCIFDGISEFEAVVNNKSEILNNTQELYVGGRKGAYCRPFYIGKLLDVVDVETKRSLLDKVQEYTFTKILMQSDITSGQKVFVRHLRVYPHYQMGGMVHLNRIRRNIVDRAYFILNGKKRKASA